MDDAVPSGVYEVGKRFEPRILSVTAAFANGHVMMRDASESFVVAMATRSPDARVGARLWVSGVPGEVEPLIPSTYELYGIPKSVPHRYAELIPTLTLWSPSWRGPLRAPHAFRDDEGLLSCPWVEKSSEVTFHVLEYSVTRARGTAGSPVVMVLLAGPEGLRAVLSDELVSKYERKTGCSWNPV